MDLLNEKVGKIFKTYNTSKNLKPQVEVISNSNSTDDSSEMIPLYSNRYKIIEKKYLFFKDLVIGSGSFGKVFYGIDINQKKEYAIKFEKSDLKNSVLNEELKIYGDLQGGEGIPKIHWSGNYSNNKVFIMDLLGPSLDKFYKISKTKTLNLETTVNFGQQMVKRIQYMHCKNYLHRDIKPNNFLLGKYNRNFNSNFIYIVDFGLSKEYKDPITKEHYPYKENRRFVGTPRYASVNTHIGIKQSRRDDLESIAYVLIFFLKSELPWQGVKAKTKSEKKEKIKLSKISTDVKQLCENLPPQIFEFLFYTKNLGYYEEPNYALLVNILESVKIERKFCLNYRFVFWEWNEVFLTAQALTKLNTKEAKSVHLLLEKNFKNLYEGYPIQDFEEYLDSLVRFKKICEDCKLNNEDCRLNNSRIILNKNYILDPNGNESDLQNSNNIVYSFENNYTGYNLKNNSNFTVVNDNNRLFNNILSLNNTNSNYLCNIPNTNEIAYTNTVDYSRNNFFQTTNFSVDNLNNNKNNNDKNINYFNLINNTNEYNNKRNYFSGCPRSNTNNEKIKIPNPFAVYSANNSNNISNSNQNLNMIVNKLNFKIENPYAESIYGNKNLNNAKNNFNINLTSYKIDQDSTKNTNQTVIDESNHEFFQQFFYKESQITKENKTDKNDNLFLGNKRLNNSNSVLNYREAKEKNYSFLKK
jgi:casein kinase 1